jgi:quercetin dioxygenase-like cupin family protein
VPRHDHDTENATLVISGATVITTDDGERRCGPGEWYETRPGEMHGVRFHVDTVQIELRFEVRPG